jgi:hypothetical protein
MTLLESVLGVHTQGFSFRPKGFINVEGGLVAVSNEYRGWCDCTAIEFGAAKSNCPDCGRSATNFANVHSGDGVDFEHPDMTLALGQTAPTLLSAAQSTPSETFTGELSNCDKFHLESVLLYIAGAHCLSD